VKQTELYKDLGELMTSQNPFKAVRKDTISGVEVSLQAKKALEEKKKKASEFECVDGEDGKFVFSGSITVMEAKKKKKRR
jgi:restriction endonuclease S subunit